MSTYDWVRELCPEIEGWQARLIAEHTAECVVAEREACAKVCEETTASWTQQDYNTGCMDCAAAIRARGEK